ncbi:MAG: hypothetical protein ACRDZR_00290 [Acidimicrobiales bacterium]
MKLAQPSEAAERETGGLASERRWFSVTRFLLAVVIGGVLTFLVWLRVPHDLSVSTDIVGYQIWADFDYRRYLDAYYLVAIAFPLLSIAACYVLGRWGPLRRRIRGMAPFWRITTVLGDRGPSIVRAAHAPGGIETAAEVEDEIGTSAPAVAEHDQERAVAPPGVASLFWAVARIAVPGFGVAIEVCLIRSPVQVELTRGGLLAGLAYLLAVAGGATLLRKVAATRPESSALRRASTWRSAIALVNSFLALSVLPLLFFVSEKTNIYVRSEHRVIYYHWLPLWLVIVALAVCLALWLRGLLRMTSVTGASDLEATVLTWLVGPLVFFLLLAVFPGAIGSFTGFDDAQFLAAPQLVFHHGLFPWREIFLLHGIFQDVFWGAVGLLVFGNTRWGGDAGIGLLMTPLFWIVVYCFTAYFCRRNRLVLVGLVVAVTTGLLQGNTFRFLVIFVFLILFHRLLRSPTWRWCALFSAFLIVACIIVPEALLFALCLAVLVVIFEAVRYHRGDSIVSTFRRTVRCGTVGIGLLAVWAIYLAVVGALGSFIDYYVIAALDHSLVGALPVQWDMARTIMTTFEFAAPVVLWLATVWRVVFKLRARKPWSLGDWMMTGAASFVLVYFPQELERMDAAHVQLVFCVALPILILWAIELLTLADDACARFLVWVRQRPRRRDGRSLGVTTSQWPKRVATTAAVVGVLAGSVTMPVAVPTLLRRIPENFHASAPDAPPASPAKLGYTLPGAVDTAQINTLGSLLNRYAGRSAPVFDFPNELGVTYYLLNRVPGTRYFVASEAQTTFAQSQTVSDLETSRPPVVIFYDASFGLPVYDGILESVRTPIIAEYLLDHYRPLVDMQGQLLMLRDDLVKTAPPLPPLPAGSQTTNLYFTSPECTLGDIPNFYAPPADLQSAPSVTVRATPVKTIGSAIGGWAVDASTGLPATLVLAVAGGKVVASAPTGLARSDVAAVLGNPSAEASGFSIEIPKSVHSPVTLYALNSDGSVTMLQRDTQSVPSAAVGGARQPTVTTADGVVHPAVETGADGWADSYQKPDEHILRLTFPRGTNFSSYHWLQLRSGASLGNSSNFLTNELGAGPEHQVGFNSLPRAGNNLSVQVGSCLQWHGYQSAAAIYLVRSGPDAGRAVSVELRR